MTRPLAEARAAVQRAEELVAATRARVKAGRDDAGVLHVSEYALRAARRRLARLEEGSKP